MIIDYESGLNVSSDFNFVDDEDGAILLTRTNMSDSDITNVYASVWDGETWVGDTQITDCSDDLRFFSACKNADGDIQFVYTTAQYETEITEDNGDGSSTGTYAETVNMYAAIHKKTTDVELVAVDFEDNDVVPGENLPVTVYVKNNGLKTIDNITVLSSCFSEEDSKTIPTNLKPGQTVEIEYSYPVPASLSGLSDVNFTVNCDGDNNSNNNTQAVQIGYADISLNLKKLSSGGLTSAVITITNNSCFATDAKVLLHKDSYDNNVMSEYLVSEIPSFGKKIFYLSADAINKNFEYEDAICVEILSSNPEKATGDNYDFFTVNKPEIEEWSYTILENNKIRIDKYNGTDSNLVMPETYDDYIVSSLGANVVPSFVNSITLPSGLETVTSTAFNSATGLTEISVNESNQLFTSKNGILFSADGTKVIRCPIAFENKTLVLPDDVIEINDYAFANVGLTFVVLPESLQMIRSYAFSNNNITTVTIPENVTRICENDSSHVEKEHHSWNNGTVTKTATCTESGIRTFTCTICGAKKTESIKATGHNYGAWTLVKAPTCTSEGVEQRVCSNDTKHVETRPIAKSAHADNDGDGYCDNCHTNLGSGGETHESNCVCGKYHTGPFAGIIKFFHRIVYFFKNLFGKN